MFIQGFLATDEMSPSRNTLHQVSNHSYLTLIDFVTLCFHICSLYRKCVCKYLHVPE